MVEVEAFVRARRGVEALALAAEIGAELEGATRAAVRAARRDGATWEQVAQALGLASRQAAHARYGTL